MSVVVFVGPSLPPALRPAEETLFEWRPPVRQGDVYRAALAHPLAIGVVDGYFDTMPTAWHKEFLWAMAQGIHVFGAASIGALRAVELEAFGMRGIGRIYRALRDSPWLDYDEVAVVARAVRVGLSERNRGDGQRPRDTRRGGSGWHSGTGPVGKADKHCQGAVLQEVAPTRRCCSPPVNAAVQRTHCANSPTGCRTDGSTRSAVTRQSMLDAIRSHLAADPGPLRTNYRLSDTVAWQAACRYRRQRLLRPDCASCE